MCYIARQGKTLKNRWSCTRTKTYSQMPKLHVFQRRLSNEHFYANCKLIVRRKRCIFGKQHNIYYIFIPQNCIKWGKELTVFPLNTSDVKVTETLVGRTGRRLGSDYLYSPSLSKTYFNEK